VTDQPRPVVYVVGCGARAAAELGRAVSLAQAAGFTACVVLTPAAMEFAGDLGALRELTGHPVRSTYKRPEEPDALPLPDAFLVSPLTFNSLNKWAAGISDTLAMGLLNESLGMGVPITAVPWLNAQLAAHPAVAPSIARLEAAGVRFTSGLGHPSTRIPGPDGKTGTPVYPWLEIEQALVEMAAAARA